MLNRFFKNICNTFLLFSLLILAVRCPSKESPQPQASKVIPIKGNPMVFLRNTIQDNESGIPAELLSPGSEWQIQLAGYFSEPQYEINSQEDAETRQAPTELSSTPQDFSESLTYYTLSTPEASSANYGLITDKTNRFQLGFTKTDNKMILSSVSFNEADLTRYNFKVHHYSVKKNNSAFNVLTSFQDEAGSHLYSFTFIRKKELTLLESTLDKVYRYLNGPGVASRWSQKEPLQVSICKHSIPKYNSLMKESILKWAPHLKNRLNIETVEVDQCPPFSDLNTLTVRHVTEWVEVLGPDSQSAHAMTLHDYYSSEILDSDIVLLETEWNEMYAQNNLTMDAPEFYNNSFLQEEYSGTMIHEFGHSLGLDHKFDGTLSIMSYDGINEIQDYDIKAIQELYPLISDSEKSSTEKNSPE